MRIELKCRCGCEMAAEAEHQDVVKNTANEWLRRHEACVPRQTIIAESPLMTHDSRPEEGWPAGMTDTEFDEIERQRKFVEKHMRQVTLHALDPERLVEWASGVSLGDQG